MPSTRGVAIRDNNVLYQPAAAPTLLQQFFREASPSRYRWRLLGIALTLIVALLDYYSEHELHVSFLYLIPITLASWKLAKGEALFVAASSALVWFVAEALILRDTPGLWIPFANMLALLIVFLTVVLILSALRKAFADQERLIGELEDALGRVKTLSGLLPMCSWCKKVRDDRGYWKAVEAYIHEHSDAAITHGICPECRTSHFAKGKGLRDIAT